MTEHQPAEFFIDRLRKSRLLERTAEETAIRQFNLEAKPSAIEAARALIAGKVITRLQGEILLSVTPQRVMIGKYRLQELLGSGGMGRVFAAEEAGSPWQVALKVLPENCTDNQGLLARFQLEAQIGLKLKHPNIIRTREISRVVDAYGPIDFVVMDLVKGATLSELIEVGGRMAVDQACDIGMQIASGLQHMHDVRMVHRDIKPSNILIGSNGAAKILDFGLTLFDDDDEEFSMAMIHGHDCLGTPDYIAPEQIGNSYEVDHRADIYSLGCTLYHALAGHPPFPYDVVQKKLLGHKSLAPRRLREINIDIPPRVEAIVHKMLAKKPADRIQTANQVVEYLRPHSERREIAFNFKDILRRRVKQDHRRSTYLKRKSSIVAGAEKKPEQ